MINFKRLHDILERISNFCRIRCGGLKRRSTTDRLVQLETVIRNWHFVNSEFVISIYKYIELKILRSHLETWHNFESASTKSPGAKVNVYIGFFYEIEYFRRD